VEDIAQSILALSERTQQIGEIISAVEDIADQSRLLALNASIEAARAGDEGLGFAVVAREMRHLSGQSRDATTKVSDILNEIQRAANTAVMVTEEGSKGAQQGMELANRSGDAIRDLTAIIEEAARVAIQIAASTHQQTNAMDQLVTAMKSIKQASTQTSASIKEAGL
jgi:methyl-accepting chemotaxis protein